MAFNYSLKLQSTNNKAQLNYKETKVNSQTIFHHLGACSLLEFVVCYLTLVLRNLCTIKSLEFFPIQIGTFRNDSKGSF